MIFKDFDCLKYNNFHKNTFRLIVEKGNNVSFQVELMCEGSFEVELMYEGRVISKLITI